MPRPGWLWGLHVGRRGLSDPWWERCFADWTKYGKNRQPSDIGDLDGVFILISALKTVVLWLCCHERASMSGFVSER